MFMLAGLIRAFRFITAAVSCLILLAAILLYSMFLMAAISVISATWMFMSMTHNNLLFYGRYQPTAFVPTICNYYNIWFGVQVPDSAPANIFPQMAIRRVKSMSTIPFQTMYFPTDMKSDWDIFWSDQFQRLASSFCINYNEASNFHWKEVTICHRSRWLPSTAIQPPRMWPMRLMR